MLPRRVYYGETTSSVSFTHHFTLNFVSFVAFLLFVDVFCVVFVEELKEFVVSLMSFDGYYSAMSYLEKRLWKLLLPLIKGSVGKADMLAKHMV